MAKRIKIFSAGCPMCETAEAQVRELAGAHQEVVVHDLRADTSAAARAAEQGVNVVPSVVVDGRLLGCCSNAGPDREELVAAGVGLPHA